MRACIRDVISSEPAATKHQAGQRVGAAALLTCDSRSRAFDDDTWLVHVTQLKKNIFQQVFWGVIVKNSDES